MCIESRYWIYLCWQVLNRWMTWDEVELKTLYSYNYMYHECICEYYVRVCNWCVQLETVINITSDFAHKQHIFLILFYVIREKLFALNHKPWLCLYLYVIYIILLCGTQKTLQGKTIYYKPPCMEWTWRESLLFHLVNIKEMGNGENKEDLFNGNKFNTIYFVKNFVYIYLVN